MPNEITLEQPGALAEIPMSVEDLVKDEQLGGKLALQDIAVPYLYILQQMSPQVNPDHAKFVKDAKPGMLYITSLEKVYDGRDKGLTIVPCYYERLFTEWVPVGSGGGLVASHDPDAEIIKKATWKEVEGRNLLMLPSGHQLVETAYHYILAYLPDTKTWTQCIAPFKSTGLKVSRRMNSAISTTMIPGTDKKAPRFLFKWKLTTIKEQKDNYVWSSPKLEQEHMVSADVYAAAKAYAIIAAKGVLRRALVEAEQELTTTADHTEAPF